MVYLNLWLPYAVWQQIKRMAERVEETVGEDRVSNTERIPVFTNGDRAAKEVEPIMREMVAGGKWKIAGSAGTGIVKGLSGEKLSNLRPDTRRDLGSLFRRRRKQVDFDKTTLNQLVGITDLRILATCLSLRKEFPNITLITGDKTLGLIAKDKDLRVIETVEGMTDQFIQAVT